MDQGRVLKGKNPAAVAGVAFFCCSSFLGCGLAFGVGSTLLLSGGINAKKM
jgi:hypothetical protein